MKLHNFLLCALWSTAFNILCGSTKDFFQWQLQMGKDDLTVGGSAALSL